MPKPTLTIIDSPAALVILRTLPHESDVRGKRLPAQISLDIDRCGSAELILTVDDALAVCAALMEFVGATAKAGGL